MNRPAEVTKIHTQIMKCDLILEESRTYWRHYTAGRPLDQEAQVAFHSYWFGSCNMRWVRLLLSNLHARFVAYPFSLPVLQQWRDITLEEQRLICHWHLQLSDPMYRRFTSELLPSRMIFHPPTITRDHVIRWIGEFSGDRWAPSSLKQIASKLLSCSRDVGLTEGTKDPRPLRYPRISRKALTYLLYLLRQIDFEGSLLENPYLRSVGLEGPILEREILACDAIILRRMGDVVEFEWRYPTLESWAETDLNKEAA